jgi:hypothetical protein
MSLTFTFISACELHRPAPSTAAFQPVNRPQYSAIFGTAPHTPVARVSPQDAVILRAQNRIGGVPPVCHLDRKGQRPLCRLSEESNGTRPEYTL